MDVNLLAQIRDMSDSELYHHIYTDHLTSVGNRKAFEALKRDHLVAILDLDSLKYINDTYGHRVGDIHMIRLVNTLTKVFNHNQIFRLAGDEFAILGTYYMDLRNRLLSVYGLFPAFSFGIGTDLATADQQLLTTKETRTHQGLRAKRGETPPWLFTLYNEVQLATA